jgi:putative nucleotidyltransferase with HDIG domain
MIRLERRDVSTEEHTRRVALLAAQVGEELKLSATARRHLAVGGLLHDIGKLAVPLAILQKPASLTDAEYTAIKRHPADGRRLLEELGGFPEAVRGLVSDHHERLDGSGYPRGLTAGEMSIETRVLAVVDVYDALVSDRVYRAAWSPERAFGLLEEESHAYDQTVVAALRRTVGCVTPDWVADVAPAAPTRARRFVPRSA